MKNKPVAMLFLCYTKGSHGHCNYDMYSIEEFDKTIARYNRECGGVLWAKLFDKTTGEIITRYPTGSISFIKE